MVTLTAIFISMSARYSIPQDLLSSLCYVESKHNIHAIHKDDGGANSLGICQIKLQTARGMGFRGTEKQLMNPATNIKYAAKYLKHNIRRYHGSINKAVISYNLGHAGDLTSTKYMRKVYKQWRGF